MPLISTGCTRAHAKTTVESPALDMPASPPREVEPVEPEPPTSPPMGLPQEPARNSPPRSRPPAREPARAEPARQESAKPEAAPVEPPKPEEVPKPPPLLQTTPATEEGAVELAIRATLARATAKLNRVDAARLNTDARTQLDTAKSFVRQADAALRAKNLVFAKNLADKAEVLAAQLAPK